MLCQSCGKHPATTHIKSIINGALSEHALCTECAQKMGYGSAFFQNTALDQLFSSFFGGGHYREKDTRRCSVCGASLSDISNSGKVGCADCYKTFLQELTPFIQRMHGNTRHCGKIPAGTALQTVEKPKEKSLREQYTEQLQTAIAEQNFELAATLRDKMNSLPEQANTTGGEGEVNGNGEKMV